ncbi:DCL family protein [Paraburkholderia sp. ZP32-5]|uniref:DCL family protein n=1 Tax=Paraburkholderia sp. ZP32-5 TaxID=2883245 RepID=UPI001F30FA4F|nr:DCL family protein [Paraburkholderia sp. ZP32-5]
MPAKPITLGPLQFGKKGDAVTYLKAILNRYDVGDRVNADDAVILKAALEHHPKAAAKIGCGVTDFSVRTADFGTKCFWVNRPDGTTEKFSITGSIYGS